MKKLALISALLLSACGGNNPVSNTLNALNPLNLLEASPEQVVAYFFEKAKQADCKAIADYFVMNADAEAVLKDCASMTEENKANLAKNKVETGTVEYSEDKKFAKVPVSVTQADGKVENVAFILDKTEQGWKIDWSKNP